MAILRIEDRDLYKLYQNFKWIESKTGKISDDLIKRYHDMYYSTLEEMAWDGAQRFNTSRLAIRNHLEAMCKHALQNNYKSYDLSLLYCDTTDDYMYQFNEDDEVWEDLKSNAENWWYGKPLLQFKLQFEGE